MTPQQIKANAPEGSTHYLEAEADIFYYKRESFNWFWWWCGEWLLEGEKQSHLSFYWFFGWECYSVVSRNTYKLKPL